MLDPLEFETEDGFVLLFGPGEPGYSLAIACGIETADGGNEFLDSVSLDREGVSDLITYLQGLMQAEAVS